MAKNKKRGPNKDGMCAVKEIKGRTHYKKIRGESNKRWDVPIIRERPDKDGMCTLYKINKEIRERTHGKKNQRDPIKDDVLRRNKRSRKDGMCYKKK